ncbi:MAG: 4Fe-4S binding protein [Candidatus Hermodarchaeota archaeon]
MTRFKIIYFFLKEILHEVEKLRIVHKIYKSDLSLGRIIDGIYSCFKCCFGVFRYYHSGTWPYQTTLNNKCIGCGVCTHKCQENAIELLRTGPRSVFIPVKKV